VYRTFQCGTFWAVLIPTAFAFHLNAVEREIVVATNTILRVMAANLTGSSQKYEANSIRIFQGLNPDIVAIQEFNYSNNTPAQIRSFIDTAFGTNFSYFRESGYAIPNGVISRYPIRTSGSWDDALIPDRGFAWTQLDLPGTNDLYVVSVHLKASSSDSLTRSNETVSLKQLIASNFPSNAFIVVAGDMNLQSRSEAALTTLKTFLSDSPIPTDAEAGGDPDTNEPRSHPYDLVLPSFSFATNLVTMTIGTRSFSNGLVFDSRVFTPLSSVAPVQFDDSGLNQHMAVLKDFRIQFTMTNHVDVPRPVLELSGTNSIRWQATPGITYTVERSTNLTNWTDAAQFTASSTNAIFTHILTAQPYQFYRVSF
jgi:endonuclease/exonuclease/phosphatase family metal-dependent hydrolase